MLAILLGFSKFPLGGLHNYVFPLAVLAKGERLALVPLCVGSLCARSDEGSRNIFRSISRYDVVNYVDASFLQIFL